MGGREMSRKMSGARPRPQAGRWAHYALAYGRTQAPWRTGVTRPEPQYGGRDTSRKTSGGAAGVAGR